MDWLLPLPVAVPLLAAAVVVATDHIVSRHVTDAIVIAAATAATVFSALILVESQRHDLLHWFGGWHPDHGVALGVSFAGEPLGAGMALLACGLTTASLVYSWGYMGDAAQPYDALMLVFCGGMAGFALTADLFNMFVWFELIGVTAYALSGYQAQQLGPVQGAVNFAIANTVAGYLILIGIALLYGRTGTLNLAQLGRELSGHHPDRLVVVAFTLLVVGLLAKAAIVPFHLWHADAHAVAPAPVCALFSGVMIQLGLLFVARVYWTVFSTALHDGRDAVRSLLLVLGVVTMLVGGLMCFLQRHLKRMLVFSTITEAGIMLTGIALLDPKSLAGAANLVLAHGLVKAGLFLVCGIVLVQLGGGDELKLHGRGRPLSAGSLLWFAGVIGLVGVPYVGTFLGHSLLDDAAAARGMHWLQPLTMVAQAVAAGTLLRAGARIFLGWGPVEDDLLSPEPRDRPIQRNATLPLLVAVTSVLLALGLAASVVPGLERRSEAAAGRFVDRAAYAARVLDGRPAPRTTARLPLDVPAAAPASVAYGVGAAVLTVAVAAFGLWYRRLPDALCRALRFLLTPVEIVRSAHSGIVGDYLLWLVGGTALVGAVWAFTLT
jgi:multicomponent Na+:H+ antiporter subunit D